MTDDATRLNIERAREALARARMDHAAAAVRTPRPADLSRLRAEEERRAKIEARAEDFRSSIRSKLGLSEHRAAPGAAAAGFAARSLSTPLCDADICAPVPPPAPGQSFVAPQAPEAPPAPPKGAVEEALTAEDGPALPPRPQAIEDEAAAGFTVEIEDEAPYETSHGAPHETSSEEPAAPPPPSQPEPIETQAPPMAAPTPERKPRRKFLGLF